MKIGDTVKYKYYTIRRDGAYQYCIVGASVRVYTSLAAAKKHIDKYL